MTAEEREAEREAEEAEDLEERIQREMFDAMAPKDLANVKSLLLAWEELQLVYDLLAQAFPLALERLSMAGVPVHDQAAVWRNFQQLSRWLDSRLGGFVDLEQNLDHPALDLMDRANLFRRLIASYAPDSVRAEVSAE